MDQADEVMNKLGLFIDLSSWSKQIDDALTTQRNSEATAKAETGAYPRSCCTFPPLSQPLCLAGPAGPIPKFKQLLDAGAKACAMFEEEEVNHGLKKVDAKFPIPHNIPTKKTQLALRCTQFSRIVVISLEK